jgi:hypothetical protein
MRATRRERAAGECGRAAGGGGARGEQPAEHDQRLRADSRAR